MATAPVLETRTFGPYRVLAKLGEGGMGVVYRAEHADTGELVALKTVQLSHESMLAGIRREIYALRNIDHPGIVRIVDDGVTDGLPWYAMELLEGTTLRTCNDERRGGIAKRIAASSGHSTTLPRRRLDEVTIQASDISHDRFEPWPKPAIDWDRRELLTLLANVCAALAAIHVKGLVHRDLKPDNIFVKNDGTPVLVDFGLAYQAAGGLAREVLEISGKLIGSPAYMSPEQIKGDLVDARADLYALGCMLYEGVTGVVPFTGSVSLILEQHVYFAPQRPSEFIEGIPPALDALIMRLLEKKPRDRLGYALDLARELVALGADRDAVTIPNGALYLYRPALAGREDVLARLVEVVETRTRGARIFLSGESGAGKTRLAMELATAAARGGMMVITSQCADISAAAGAAPPLHAFRPLLQTIADRCRSKGPSEVKRLLGDRAPLLAPYEPALASLAGDDASPKVAELSADAAKQRALAALTQTLEAFAERTRMLLVLDDLQWADELSMALLDRLDQAHLARTGILLIGTFRSEEAKEPLRRLAAQSDAIHVEVERLAPESISRMVGDMLAIPKPPEAFVDCLSRASEGNAFFVGEYLRVAMDEGVIARSDSGQWNIAWGDGADLPLPSGLREIVLRRFDDAHPDARRVWQTAAAMGRELDADALLEAAGLTREDGARALEILRFKQVLEEAAAGKLRFRHDKLREIVYAAIPEERIPGVHASVARALEAHLDREADRALMTPVLGHHFSRAKMPEKAAVYFEQGGMLAQANGAGHDASAAYARALGELDSIARTELDGQPLWLVRGRIERRLGSTNYDIGALKAGEAHCLAALTHLTRRPRTSTARDRGTSPSRTRALFAALRALTRQMLRLVGIRRRLAEGAVERERLREIARAAEQISVIYFFENEPSLSFGAALEAVSAAEGVGPCPELARGYANLGIAWNFVGLRSIVARYEQLAEKAAADAGDPAATSWTLRMKAMGDLGQGRLADAQERFLQSLEIDRKIQDRRAEQETLALLGNAVQLAGGAERALGYYTELGDLARRSRNRQGTAWSLAGSTACLIDLERYDEAITTVDEARALAAETGDISTLINCAITGPIRVRRGELDGALAIARETMELVRSAENAAYQVYQGLSAAAETFVLLVERASSDAERRGLAKEARKALLALERHANIFGVAVPFAELWRGAFDVVRGAKARGLRRLESAKGAARGRGMPLVEARVDRELTERSRGALANTA